MRRPSAPGAARMSTPPGHSPQQPDSRRLLRSPATPASRCTHTARPAKATPATAARGASAIVGNTLTARLRVKRRDRPIFGRGVVAGDPENSRASRRAPRLDGSPNADSPAPRCCSSDFIPCAPQRLRRHRTAPSDFSAVPRFPPTTTIAAARPRRYADARGARLKSASVGEHIDRRRLRAPAISKTRSTRRGSPPKPPTPGGTRANSFMYPGCRAALRGQRDVRMLERDRRRVKNRRRSAGPLAPKILSTPAARLPKTTHSSKTNPLPASGDPMTTTAPASPPRPIPPPSARSPASGRNDARIRPTW